VEYEGFAVLRCERCSGHLVTVSRLECIKNIAGKSRDELKAEAAAEFHGSNTERVKCPRCHMAMRKQAIRLPVLALEMDVCLPCSLVWLDGGELALAQLGHEASAGFADVQEMKRRMAELEASPERKAVFEANLAKALDPDAPDPDEDTLEEVAGEALGAILRGYLLR
jgi:Zn-finger nucleic acid-binding protein